MTTATPEVLMQQTGSSQAPTSGQTIIRTLPNGDVTVITPESRTAPPAPPAHSEMPLSSIPLTEPTVTMLSLGSLALIALVLFPLVRAIARRIEGRDPRRDPRVEGEIDELRARVNALEGQQGQMQELAERLDFAERLLSARREEEKVR